MRKDAIFYQIEFQWLIRRQIRNDRHLKQDDAFNRTWLVLSIDKLVTWQHLSIERIGGHVVLMLKVPNYSLPNLPQSLGKKLKFWNFKYP